MTRTKREPVVVVMSALAALQFFFAGWSGINFVQGNPTLTAIGIIGNLAVAALQTGAQFYVRGQVTPVEDIHEVIDAKHVEGELSAKVAQRAGQRYEGGTYPDYPPKP
jgi:hypothetical protein